MNMNINYYIFIVLIQTFTYNFNFIILRMSTKKMQWEDLTEDRFGFIDVCFK